MLSLESLCISLLVASTVTIHGFSVGDSSRRTSFQPLRSSTTEPLSDEPTTVKKQTQTLGLLTFDLDDSLYPISKVEEEANEAFVKSMAQYGFEGLRPSDIVRAAQEIRDEVAKTDSAKAAALTHGELRLMAIRREMERVVVERKLQACADDWATTVDSLSALVVANSKKYVSSLDWHMAYLTIVYLDGPKLRCMIILFGRYPLRGKWNVITARNAICTRKYWKS